MIIYNYNSTIESDEDTINRFIDVAKKEPLTNEDIEKIHQKIAVVQYDSETKLHAFKLDYLD